MKKNTNEYINKVKYKGVPNRTILQGDVLSEIKKIPDESIDCIISSPPYWGLRDYGVEGQWGLESDFRDYLAKIRSLMFELKRVLKKTGSCWINLGDCYSGSGKGFGGDPEASKEVSFQSGKPLLNYTIEAKSLFGIPQRFFIQCIDDGWIARNYNIWYKENAMPSSVKDRFTDKYEPVMFFVKNQKYYFNLNAVREKPKTETKPFNLRVREAKKGKGQLKLGDDPRAWKASKQELEEHNEKGERKYGNFRNKDKYRDYDIHSNTARLSLNNAKKKQDLVLGSDGKPKTNYAGFNERWKVQNQHRESLHYADSEGYNPLGKNPGNVFFINPRPLLEAHFATFPPKLPLKILKCACPNQVCTTCGTPRFPIIKPTKDYELYLESIKGLDSGNLEKGYQNYKSQTLSTTSYDKVVDFSKCGCNAKFEAGIVLDPFFGAGTVGVAAEELGINWIGIELKDEYIQIAKKRLDPYKNKRLEEILN